MSSLLGGLRPAAEPGDLGRFVLSPTKMAKKPCQVSANLCQVSAKFPLRCTDNQPSDPKRKISESAGFRRSGEIAKGSVPENRSGTAISGGEGDSPGHRLRW